MVVFKKNIHIKDKFKNNKNKYKRTIMNILLFFTICGFLLLLIVFNQRKCWYFIWQLNGFRGLLQQPILWLILIIYLEPKSIMSSIQRYHKYFQFPLAIIVFNRILLYVDDPYTMESILTAPECLNKPFLQNGFYANKGLLHAKDEQWKIRRKQLNPAFSHNTLVSFFDVFNRVANDLKLKISEDLQGYTVKFKSLEDLIIRAVLEVSCLTTMGYETNFLKQDEKCIAQSYRYLMELTALRILRPWYQIDFIFRLLDSKNYKKSKRANKLVNEFVENIVQQKHTEWQYKHRLPQKPDIKSMTSDCATATNRAKNEGVVLNEHRDNNDFTGNTTADGNDALKIITQQILTLPDKNQDSNSLMLKEQQQQQQQSRIFIDQIFYLAQMGKLTLNDIMNESQSMIVASFETVSSCIINALLCLAMNHECQTKLRQEIKQVLLLSKNKSKRKNKNKSKLTTTTTKKSSKKPNTKGNSANTIKSDLDFDATANVLNKGDVNYSSSIECNENDDDAADNNDDVAEVEVTIDDLLNMSYLDMIINESLRLLTTIPMNLRNVSTDFQLNVMQRDTCTSICNAKNHTNKNINRCSSSCCFCQRSVVVPKDTIVALNIFNMQRNEMYWGKNALKFYPEHFSKKSPTQHQEKEGKDMEEKQIHKTSISSTLATSTSRHSYTFIPFSKGLRTCIGYRYSIYLSKIVLIKLISSFEVSTNIQLQDLQCYEGISLKFRNAEGIQFQIQPLG